MPLFEPLFYIISFWKRYLLDLFDFKIGRSFGLETGDPVYAKASLSVVLYAALSMFAIGMVTNTLGFWSSFKSGRDTFAGSYIKGICKWK